MADADVKEPTWMTQWRRYPVIWISSYIDIDISRYRYIQQSCCVILFVIEMCVNHWWRESQNQPNTNNWQVFHCIVFNASWESSQRSQKRKHHDHLMMSSLEYWYGLKNLLKNHSFIQSDFLDTCFDLQHWQGWRPALAGAAETFTFLHNPGSGPQMR